MARILALALCAAVAVACMPVASAWGPADVYATSQGGSPSNYLGSIPTWLFSSTNVKICFNPNDGVDPLVSICKGFGPLDIPTSFSLTSGFSLAAGLYTKSFSGCTVIKASRNTLFTKENGLTCFTHQGAYSASLISVTNQMAKSFGGNVGCTMPGRCKLVVTAF